MKQPQQAASHDETDGVVSSAAESAQACSASKSLVGDREKVCGMPRQGMKQPQQEASKAETDGVVSSAAECAQACSASKSVTWFDTDVSGLCGVGGSTSFSSGGAADGAPRPRHVRAAFVQQRGKCGARAPSAAGTACAAPLPGPPAATMQMLRAPAPPTPSKQKTRAAFRRRGKLAVAVGAALCGNASVPSPAPDLPQGPSKLRLKLNRVVRKSRRADKMDVFMKSIMTQVISLRDQIALTSGKAEKVLRMLNAGKPEGSSADSSFCSAASTEDERALPQPRPGISMRMSRWPSRFAAGRSPLRTRVRNSELFIGPPTPSPFKHSSRSRPRVLRRTPVSSSRRRGVKKYLDDSDEDEGKAEQAEEQEEQVRTPQDRYVPGLGRVKVVYNMAGKALRLHTDIQEVSCQPPDDADPAQQGQEACEIKHGLEAAGVDELEELQLRLAKAQVLRTAKRGLRLATMGPNTEAEGSWLVIYDPPLQPVPPSQAASKLPLTKGRSAFRRRLRGES
jgi:hypothetical protein